ncbi:hypothetical protein [Rhodococcus sp. BS-15]|uniref:hypothetical protein n=1 Tax=Rhodococcus sp. BS-15 TaxID=1304954 RepID=UPI000A46B076|nr:hypothetical protein [Rhodococcus sp. BS-15]
MRNLVIVLLLFGFVVGLAPLGWYLIGEMTTNTSGVVYQGAYEPLEGVSMSSETMERFDRAFDRRSQGPSTLWLYVLPAVSAATGALIGAILGKLGFVLSRNRTREG